MNNLEKRATLEPLTSGSRWVGQNMRLADRLELLRYRREAKALRCCGRARQFDGGDLFPGLPCNRKFCPACRAFGQYKKFGSLQARVLDLVVPGGASGFVTLTLPTWVSGTIHERTRFLREAFSSLLRRQAWKGPKGFKNDLGLVVGTEISYGGDDNGHPHLHALPAGLDAARVEAAGAWLLEAWHDQIPGASPQAQHAEAVDSSPVVLMARLSYVLKGSPVDPDLPEDLLLGLVEELSCGRQHVTVSGLLRTPRRRRGAETEVVNGAVGAEWEPEGDPGEETA